MGPNSAAQIPVKGNVDTSWEIILNAFSTGYDALNSIMLTKRSGFFDKTTMQEINGRFGILRMLAGHQAPHASHVVEKIYKIVLDNYHNVIGDIQALNSLRNVALEHGLDTGQIDNAIMRINQAEMVSHQGFGQMFPFWTQSNRKTNKKYYHRRNII